MRAAGWSLLDYGRQRRGGRRPPGPVAFRLAGVEVVSYFSRLCREHDFR